MQDWIGMLEEVKAAIAAKEEACDSEENKDSPSEERVDSLTEERERLEEIRDALEDYLALKD